MTSKNRLLVVAYLAALAGLAFWLAIGWHSRRTAETRLPSVDERIASHLRGNPAVPDMEAGIDGVLSRESVALPQQGNAAPIRWKDLPILAGDIVQTVASNPATLDLRNLLRHPQLNPGDIEVDERAWRSEEERLRTTLQKIQKLISLEATAADAEMKSAVASGLASGSELIRSQSTDGVEYSIPPDLVKRKYPIYGAHSTGGKGYVFALEELPQTFASVQLREAMSMDYFSDALRFLVEHGCLDRNKSITILESVYKQPRTLI